MMFGSGRQIEDIYVLQAEVQCHLPGCPSFPQVKTTVIDLDPAWHSALVAVK
jgi:hypothetical protein